MLPTRGLSSYTLALLAWLALDALAAPSPYVPSQAIQLTRRSVNRTYEDWGKWAAARKAGLASKYGQHASPEKRGSGTNLMVNQNADSSYYGSLAVGTPPVAFNVILDTGSSDLWLADQDCIAGCETVPTFNALESSTFTNLSTPFQIRYGSGEASGVLGRDVVQMAGFSVQNQVFAICDVVSTGLLTNPVSGLLGLGFQTIASSRATPLWQTLVDNGAWDEPAMTFQLTRFVDQRAAEALEPGGTFTMGFINQSLYSGDIDYQDIPGGRGTYWLLPLTELTVQGSAITLPSGSGSYAAIDTGTTLVGGPSTIIAAMYAQIPGAVAGTGNFEGYFIYPCDTTVAVTMTFGGRTWSISPADFRLTVISSTRNQCLGAFFQLDMGSGAPAWIVGDTFLKNVYSIFRYDPPSVGFAELSDVALAMAQDDSLPVPTPTMGNVQAQVTAAGGNQRGAAAPALRLSMSTVLAAAVLAMVVGVLW